MKAKTIVTHSSSEISGDTGSQRTLSDMGVKTIVSTIDSVDSINPGPKGNLTLPPLQEYSAQILEGMFPTDIAWPSRRRIAQARYSAIYPLVQYDLGRDQSTAERVLDDCMYRQARFALLLWGFSQTASDIRKGEDAGIMEKQELAGISMPVRGADFEKGILAATEGMPVIGLANPLFPVGSDSEGIPKLHYDLTSTAWQKKVRELIDAAEIIFLVVAGDPPLSRLSYRLNRCRSHG